MGSGKLSAYAYLLEVDNTAPNALDTYGLRYTGQSGSDVKLLYTAEFANQTNESATAEFDADYMLAEAGVKVSGILLKAGYEVLSSDNGGYGFSTPLATLHKFNGWADVFLATPAEGLADFYIHAGTKLLGGKTALIYHTFKADQPTATIDDLGSEVDFIYSRKFSKNWSAGIKYAAYSAGDTSGTRVDTDKLWFWVGLSN